MTDLHIRQPRSLLAIAIGTALWSSIPAFAQVQLEEIVVTAQKREQTLQDVPVAVSAFSEKFIAEANIQDIRGVVDLTPGFSGRTEDSFIDALAIRGIVTNDFGIGGDPSVAIFTDGVWSGRTGGVQMNFYDIERVEVVKGPQATLFGRNAIAGAVSIITNKPIEEFEGSIAGGIGDYGHYDAHGMVNVPLTDSWYYRGNVYMNLDDGYLHNIQGGDDLGMHEQYSTRQALRYAGENVDATFTLSYEDRSQDPSVYWDPAAGIDKDKVNTDLGDRGYDKSEIWGFNAIVDWEISDTYSFHSITGYKTYDFKYREDYDAGPELVNDYVQNNDVEFFSQEFRINYAGDSVTWFAGVSAYDETIDGEFLYYYDEDALCRAIGRTDAPDFSGPVSQCDDPVFEEYWEADIDPALIDHNKFEAGYNDMESKGYSIYGDITWSVTEALDVTVGARWTYDEKDMRSRVAKSGGALGNNFNWEFHTRGFLQDDDNWSELTPRLAVNYTVSDSVSLYGNIASGYKAGGFGTFGIDIPDRDGDGEPDISNSGQAAPGSRPLGFDPETSVSGEIGAKTRLLDDTMQLNIDYFRYTYEDLQLLYFDKGSSQVQNLGEAENQGIEVDMHWLIGDHWDLFAAGAWMHSEITDAKEMLELGVCGDCDGKKMPFAPDWSGAIHLTWRTPLWGGEFFAKGELAYRDTMFSDLDNISNIAANEMREWNFRAGWDDADETWGVIAYVENAFNEDYFERGWANGDARGQYGYGLPNSLVWPSKPRSIGVSAHMKF